MPVSICRYLNRTAQCTILADTSLGFRTKPEKRPMIRLGPIAVYRWCLKRWHAATVRPPVGTVDFGDLRVLAPVSQEFGYDRGVPIDRYFIEQFLDKNRESIRDRVLEIGDDEYSKRFGAERVTSIDVLHVSEGNPKATLVADLTNAKNIESDRFDCVILTQTLQFIFDHRTALETLHRILKPGGTLLATVPGITKIPQDEWGELCAWSYTKNSVTRLVAEAFPQSFLCVESKGNVLAATAFLQGLASRELSGDELDYVDPLYPVLISIKATKGGVSDGDR
jgi:SAM-dependent methyltransferase